MTYGTVRVHPDEGLARLEFPSRMHLSDDVPEAEAGRPGEGQRGNDMGGHELWGVYTKLWYKVDARRDPKGSHKMKGKRERGK